MQALNAWLVGHDHGLLLQGLIQPPPVDGSGVREPLRPLPPVRTNRAYYDED